MGFTDAVKTCFSKYATFEGRASRSEFWWFWLFIILGNFVLTGADVGVMHARAGMGFLGGIFVLATLLPSIAVGVRRLHDTNRSGWFIFLPIIPLIGAVILIYFYVKDSDPGDNAYGPNPLAAGPA